MRPLHDLNPVRLAVRRTGRRRCRDARCSTSGAVAACWPKPWHARARSSPASTSPTTCCEVAQLHALETGDRGRLPARGRRETRRSNTPRRTTWSPAWRCWSTFRTPRRSYARSASWCDPEVTSSCRRSIARRARMHSPWSARSTCCACCPPGTHTYEKFIRPSELVQLGARGRARRSSDIAGLDYDPFARTRSLEHGCERKLPRAPASHRPRAPLPRHEATRRRCCFDLDGTMLDTAPDMGGRSEPPADEEGRDTAARFAQVRPVVSHGAARLVTLGFPEARRRRIRATASALPASSIRRHLRQSTRGCFRAARRAARRARTPTDCPGAS